MNAIDKCMYGFLIMLIVGAVLTLGELGVRLMVRKARRRGFVAYRSTYDERNSIKVFRRMNS